MEGPQKSDKKKMEKRFQNVVFPGKTRKKNTGKGGKKNTGKSGSKGKSTGDKNVGKAEKGQK